MLPYRASRVLTKDLLIATGVTFALGWLTSAFDGFEWLYTQTRRFERFELDEIPCFIFGGLVAFGFLLIRYIYLLRRMSKELNDTHEILRKHTETQTQKEKLAALGKMASGLAHEISNALQPTIGLGGFIREGLREQGKVRHSAFMDVMIDSARHAQHIIDNMLAFSQDRALTLSPAQAAVAVEQAISFAAERMASTIRIEMRGLDLLEGEQGKPLMINCNHTALTQIIYNILKNAAIAMGHEGTINIDCLPSCPLNDDKPHYGLSLSITDHGCGMNAETLRKIFDPFFTTKDVSEGTGLGLPVVYGLMQQHGGDISVTSKPGEGTTFRLSFPAYIAED